MRGRERVELKTPGQVRAMRRAGLVVAEALAAVREVAAPGATTDDLDAVASRVITGAGATASFLGYHGYPKSLCTSINEEVVHGIPGPRVLAAGDLVSVDCGAVVDGWHGDAAISFVLRDGAGDGGREGGGGAGDRRDEALVAATEAAMWAGIAALRVGGRLGDVGGAVEDSVDSSAAQLGVPLGIVEGYVGHGIGTAMHQAPEVLNHRVRGRGAKLRAGLCVAVEPMVVLGDPTTDVLGDEWTVVTHHGGRAAHWEHTVALGADGPWVLTAVDGGAAALAVLGVSVAPLA